MQKQHIDFLITQATDYGITVVKERVSQTWLNFYDAYSVLDDIINDWKNDAQGNQKNFQATATLGAPGFGCQYPIKEDEKEQDSLSSDSDGGMQIQEMSDTFVLSIEAKKNIENMCSEVNSGDRYDENAPDS